MPWKFTKLVYYGVAVRRRTLYIIALATSIVAVPLVTWSLLTLDHPDILKPQRLMYTAAAMLAVLLALNAWRHVLQRKVILYWEEARFIWPVAMLLLIFATSLSSNVGEQLPPAIWTNHPVEMPLALSCIMASPLFILVLWRWIRLPQTERRYEYPDPEQPQEPPAGAPSPSSQNPPGPNPPTA